MTLKGWLTFAYWVVIHRIKPIRLIAVYDPISQRTKFMPKHNKEKQ